MAEEAGELLLHLIVLSGKHVTEGSNYRRTQVYSKESSR